jgi:hypothetical protein
VWRRTSPLVLLERDIERARCQSCTLLRASLARARTRLRDTLPLPRCSVIVGDVQLACTRNELVRSLHLLQCPQLCRAFLARCGVCHRYILSNVDSPGEVDQGVPRRHTLVPKHFLRHDVVNWVAVRADGQSRTVAGA